MKLELTPTEVRILGVLIEKERTTPENYPLSLNAMTNACNQKTAREPIMSLAESTVLDAVGSLIHKTLVAERSGAGSRVAKYGHRLANRLGDELNFSDAELAVLAVLMLRGPQTSGEIRSRCVRLYEFRDTPALEQTLNELMTREDGPFVSRLSRQAGRKESRYAHLFGGEADLETERTGGAESAASAAHTDDQRIVELETKVQSLEQQLAQLQQRLDDFIRQFET